MLVMLQASQGADGVISDRVSGCEGAVCQSVRYSLPLRVAGKLGQRVVGECAGTLDVSLCQGGLRALVGPAGGEDIIAQLTDQARHSGGPGLPEVTAGSC
jgi:hypothetical protein